MSSKSELRRLTGLGDCFPGPGDGPCGEGDCPNVYATENGTFVVQGAVFTGFMPPSGGLPNEDFWLFDESRVVLMNYDADGHQISRELYDGDPEPYVKWKNLALKESVPFLDYVNDDRS